MIRFSPYKKGRVSIKRKPRGLEITIPTQANIFVVGFLCFWLCGWTMGEFFALKVLFLSKSPPPLPVMFFMFFWVTFWTIGGFFALVTVLWMLFGREIIFVDSRYLSITRQIFMWKQVYKIELPQISNLRLEASSSKSFNNAVNNKLRNAPPQVIGFDVAPGENKGKSGSGIIIPWGIGDKKQPGSFGEGLGPEDLDSVMLALKECGYLRREAFYQPSQDGDSDGGEEYVLPPSFSDVD